MNKQNHFPSSVIDAFIVTALHCKMSLRKAKKREEICPAAQTVETDKLSLFSPFSSAFMADNSSSPSSPPLGALKGRKNLKISLCGKSNKKEEKLEMGRGPQCNLPCPPPPPAKRKLLWNATKQNPEDEEETETEQIALRILSATVLKKERRDRGKKEKKLFFRLFFSFSSYCIFGSLSSYFSSF